MAHPLPDDPVLRAHLRRQQDWATDGPALMARPNEDAAKREALIAELDARDNAARKQAGSTKPKRAPRKTAARAKPAPRKTTAKTAKTAKAATKAKPPARRKPAASKSEKD